MARGRPINPACIPLGTLGRGHKWLFGRVIHRFGDSANADHALGAFIAMDTAERDVFDGIFNALNEASRPIIGPAEPRLLVIPIRNEAGLVTGGLWGTTLFRWFEIEMLVVPARMRRRGIGSALLATAEAEARNRGCLGVCVDTLSFQAGPFYAKHDFALFAALDDCPPGHQRLFFYKRLS